MRIEELKSLPRREGLFPGFLGSASQVLTPRNVRFFRRFRTSFTHTSTQAVCILAYGATGSGKTHTVTNLAHRAAVELERQAKGDEGQ